MSRNSDLKTDNTHLVRTCFYDGKIWTKNALSQKTGLSLAATTNILQILLHEQEIEFIGEAASTGGRKSKQYMINKDYTHLGIIICKRDDLHYDFIVKVCHLLDQIVWEKEYNCQHGDMDDVIEVMKDMLFHDPLISTVTVSIPGVCQAGVINICDFEALAQQDFVSQLQQQFAVNVYIENDVNVACMGLSSHYPQISHMALMYQPKVKYIGCGMILNHHLYDGFSHFAGELSYIPFLSFSQQEKMLKDNPQQLLLYQLITLCTVINPQLIGLCSDVLECFDESLMNDYLPEEHRPKIVWINDIDEYIKDGLFDLGKCMFMNKKGDRENGKVY